MSNFKEWIFKNKTLDTIIIGYFLASSISTFYESAFESFFTPLLDIIVPGSEDTAWEVMGVKIKIHTFVLSLVQLIFSLVLAYYIRKIFTNTKNGK
jgi:energy-converting hydrogenase Eha subunit A